MGWFGEYNPRSDLIKEINQTFENEKHTNKMLKWCYRGNRFTGVLWSVREVCEKSTNKMERYIACDLLQYWNKEKAWYYKPMDESMGPFYYSCPLGYLNMATEPVNETAREWREKVKEHHNKRK